MSSGTRKQFVRILKDCKCDQYVYKKGEKLELDCLFSDNCLAYLKVGGCVTLTNDDIYGKEAELINNFQNNYELWD